jgi:hypothetical protein
VPVQKVTRSMTHSEALEGQFRDSMSWYIPGYTSIY